MATNFGGGPTVIWHGQPVQLPQGSTVDPDGTIHFPGARGSGAVPGTPNYDQSMYALTANQGATASDPMDRQLQVLTAESRSDPNFKLPEGFTKDDQGNVIVDRGSWLARNWGLLLAGGLLGGAGLSAAGAFGGGAAGAGEAAGAGTGMTVTELGSPLAVGSTSAGSLSAAAGGGAAGAAGAAGGAAGGVAGGAAGASGGGSTFGQILNTAGKFGNALQGYEQGRQQGRVADALLQQRQDQNAMEAARLNLQAPADRASNAVQGDILANAQDFHFNPGFGTGSTGGLRPSIFSPQTRQLGALQSAQALANAQKNNGDVFTPTPLPQPSKLDSILNTAAPIGNLLSLIPYKGSSDWYGGS